VYSIFILLLAAIGLGVCLSALLLWQRSRSNLLLFNLAALGAVTLDLLIAGAGHWIGAGEQLRGLYALPALVSTFALPLTLFTFATISRGSGFAWAKIDWGHGAVCLFAVALLVYSLPDILRLRFIYPSCWHDVLWYRPAVAPGMACAHGAATAPLDPPFPLVRWCVLLAYFGLGTGLWLRQHWPWLLAATGAGIGLILLPRSWGPLPGFLGELLCFCGISVAAARYVAMTPRPASLTAV
jgi:hypothetical protein